MQSTYACGTISAKNEIIFREEAREIVPFIQIWLSGISKNRWKIQRCNF